MKTIVKVGEVRFKNRVTDYAVSADFHRIVAATPHGIELIDTPSDTRQFYKAERPDFPSSSADGAVIAWACGTDLFIKSLDVDEERMVTFTEPICGLAVSGNGDDVTVLAGDSLQCFRWRVDHIDLAGTLDGNIDSWRLSYHTTGNGGEVLLGASGRKSFSLYQGKGVQLTSSRGKILAAYPNGSVACNQLSSFLGGIFLDGPSCGNILLRIAPSFLSKQAAALEHAGQRTFVFSSGYRLFVLNRGDEKHHNILLPRPARRIYLGCLGQLVAAGTKSSVIFYHNLMQSIRLLNNPADEFARAQAKLVLTRLGGKEVLQALATEEINEDSDIDCGDIMCAIEDKISQQECAAEEEKHDRIRAARHYKKEQALAKIKAHEEGELVALEEEMAALESKATEGRRRLARQKVRFGGSGSPEDFLSTMLINQARQEIIKVKASSDTAEQALKKAEYLLQENRTKCETISANIESAFEEGAQAQAAGYSAEEEMEFALTIAFHQDNLAGEEKYMAWAQRHVDSLGAKCRTYQRRLLELDKIIEGNQQQQKMARMTAIAEHAIQVDDEDNHEQRLAMLQEASNRLKETLVAKEQTSTRILPTPEDPACDAIIAKMRKRAQAIKNSSGNRNG